MPSTCWTGMFWTSCTSSWWSCAAARVTSSVTHALATWRLVSISGACTHMHTHAHACTHTHPQTKTKLHTYGIRGGKYTLCRSLFLCLCLTLPLCHTHAYTPAFWAATHTMLMESRPFHIPSWSSPPDAGPVSHLIQLWQFSCCSISNFSSCIFSLLKHFTIW